jgi:hypothetical protein
VPSTDDICEPPDRRLPGYVFPPTASPADWTATFSPLAISYHTHPTGWTTTAWLYATFTTAGIVDDDDRVTLLLNWAHRRIREHANRLGFWVHETVEWEVSFESPIPVWTATVKLRGRSDGEWPAIHLALREDEADRRLTVFLPEDDLSGP